MKEIAQPSENWIKKMIEAYKQAYFGEEAIDMEEFNFDNYDKPFIWTTIKQKEDCIKRLFEERIERNLEWDLEDELSKPKYKKKQLSRKELSDIKKSVKEKTKNIPLDEQLEIYADLWPHDKHRPVIL